MIALICAMGKNRVIGKDNRLPWHLPADLAYFKTITAGHTVVMGRRTFQSLGGPLAQRNNIVLTKNPQFQFKGCLTVPSIAPVLELARQEEVMVIGGAMVFREFLPYAGRLYLTEIDAEFEGDAYFLELDSSWHLVSSLKGTKNSLNPFEYQFCIYERDKLLLKSLI